MEKRGLLSSMKTSAGQRQFNQKDLDKCLKKSQRKGVRSVAESPVLYEAISKVEPYFQQGSMSIYNADFLKIDCIEEGTIDLIVTSPPYNVGIKYGSHDDKMSYEDYLYFTREWLSKCYRLTKEDGRFCLNIPLDKNKGGQQSVCADITTIAKEVGWKYHATIVWNEQNISRRTAWGSWLSASAPYVIAPVEVIVVLYKNRWKKLGNNGKSDITKNEFVAWTNAVWNFMGESGKRVGHPAPFPVELPKRCIKLFTFVGDTVLDPFLGSGSTLIACVLANRKGVGVEIDKNYCDIAKQRLIKEANIWQFKLIRGAEQ
jgi:site-specific DNA-methyltransferase (adenine-specific)